MTEVETYGVARAKMPWTAATESVTEALSNAVTKSQVEVESSPQKTITRPARKAKQTGKESAKMWVVPSSEACDVS